MSVRVRETHQPSEVAGRIDTLVRGVVVGVGGPAPGRLPGMDLDELSLVVGLDELGVDAHLDVFSDELSRHRVERVQDRYVMVGMDLGL